MPPLALLPNQPAGMPDIAYGYGGDGSAVYAGSGNYGSGGYGSTGNANDTLNRYLQGEADQRTEAKRQFDVKYDLDKKAADRTYQVAMMGARTQQDQQRALQEYQRAQSEIAKERLAFDRQTQQQNFGLQQAGLGYNVLNMASQLRGPQNYFQASNFARGVNAQPGTATFLDALQNNSRLAGFGAQAGAPDAVSLGSILGGGTSQGVGGSGSGGGADNSYLNQIHALGLAGGGKIGAGQWESLTGDEQKLFLSGLEAPDSQGKAYSASTFLDQLNRSRIGQNTSGYGYRAA